MRCKPGQDFLPYDRPIAVSKSGSTSSHETISTYFIKQVANGTPSARARNYGAMQVVLLK